MPSPQLPKGEEMPQMSLPNCELQTIHEAAI
jgi:hypothetical protein